MDLFPPDRALGLRRDALMLDVDAFRMYRHVDGRAGLRVVARDGRVYDLLFTPQDLEHLHAQVDGARTLPS